MAFVKTSDDLADVIAGMTYGELMDVCSILSQMAEDKESRPTMRATEDFASLLWDWAESHHEEKSAAEAEAADEPQAG